MPIFRATWFFEDPTYSFGWSENWFVSAADADAVNIAVTPYDAKRCALMMTTSFIRQFRVCNTDGSRDSKYFALGGAVQGTIDATAINSAGVWDCLLLRRDGAANNVLGHMFMHRVPELIFSGRSYVGHAGAPYDWNTFFNTFKTEVTGGTYQLRKFVAGAPTYVPCTQLVAMRRTERRVGRPFDQLRGRRRTA